MSPSVRVGPTRPMLIQGRPCQLSTCLTTPKHLVKYGRLASGPWICVKLLRHHPSGIPHLICDSRAQFREVSPRHILQHSRVHCKSLAERLQSWSNMYQIALISTWRGDMRFLGSFILGSLVNNLLLVSGTCFLLGGIVNMRDARGNGVRQVFARGMSQMSIALMSLFTALCVVVTAVNPTNARVRVCRIRADVKTGKWFCSRPQERSCLADLARRISDPTLSLSAISLVQLAYT